LTTVTDPRPVSGQETGRTNRPATGPINLIHAAVRDSNLPPARVTAIRASHTIGRRREPRPPLSPKRCSTIAPGQNGRPCKCKPGGSKSILSRCAPRGIPTHAPLNKPSVEPLFTCQRASKRQAASK
jgi:hypothetical protein